MELLKYSILLLSCEQYRNDKVMKGLLGVFSEECSKALDSYALVCRALFAENKTMSDYMFFLAVSGENPVLNGYLKSRSNTLFSALKNDLSVLSAVSRLKSAEIIDYLRKKFGLDEKICFPEFETGDTVVSAESVIAFSERFGNTLFAYNKAFIFENGTLSPSLNADEIRLSELKNYDNQRRRLLDNTICFINGTKAQNALLYGDRGTGKSSTVKAIVNEYSELRIIQISKSSICDIYKVYDIIKDNPLKFILFIDDITFSENDAGYSFLKQVLEGSVMSIPKNCVIYATTNRRHIIKETESERTGDEMHAADARDENMSLADRFGLYITFISPNKNEYLDIARQIADDRKLNISAEKFNQLAERFALKKCGRSPRTARQFVDMLEARLKLGLEPDNI